MRGRVDFFGAGPFISQEKERADTGVSSWAEATVEAFPFVAMRFAPQGPSARRKLLPAPPFRALLRPMSCETAMGDTGLTTARSLLGERRNGWRLVHPRWSQSSRGRILKGEVINLIAGGDAMMSGRANGEKVTQRATRLLMGQLALAVLLSVGARTVRAQCPQSGTDNISWSGGNGDWSSGSQWSSPGCSPNDTSIEFFNVSITGTNDTVTLDTGPTTIDSLTLGFGETLTDGGVAQSLTIGSSNSGNSLDAVLSNAGTISLSAATSTLIINGSAFSTQSINETNTGAINLSNGAALVLNDGRGQDRFLIRRAAVA